MSLGSAAKRTQMLDRRDACRHRHLRSVVLGLPMDDDWRKGKGGDKFFGGLKGFCIPADHAHIPRICKETVPLLPRDFLHDTEFDQIV